MRTNLTPGSPLVAAWIDSDMHCFERDTELLSENVREEPGGVLSFPLLKWMFVVKFTDDPS